MSSSYQLMPPPSHIEMAELRASIEKHGVQVPVIVDEHGNVVDGHHRQKLAAELGVDCPRVVREGLTDEQKRTLARTLNTARRHLTRKQMRALIAGQLCDTPERSDRQIAASLGVHNETVNSVRKDLEARDGFRHVETRTDTKGRKQPAKKTVPTKPAKLKAPPPVVERSLPPEAVRDPLRAFNESFETHRKELEGVFVAEIDKLGRYAKDPYVVVNVKRVVDKIRRALDAFRSSVGGRV
jgi:ParB-like chromosome segregation protein Spo0J